MHLIVDKKKKKKLLHNALKLYKPAHYVYIIEKSLLIILLAFIVIYPLVCYLTDYHVMINTFTQKKSYLLVIDNVIWAACMLSIPFFIWVLRMNLQFAYIGGLSGEALSIEDGKLIYTFTYLFKSLLGSRNLLIVDLNKIDRLTYDEITHKIELEGMMVEVIFKPDSKIDEFDLEKMETNKVVLFDYFSPSLIEILREYV